MADRPRARRCPECNTVNRPTVPYCECGHVFDAAQAHAVSLDVMGVRGTETNEIAPETVADQRHFHTHRLTIGWFMVIGFALLLPLSFLLGFVISFAAVFPATACAAGLLKGASMIGNARARLRELDARLPKAKLVTR